MLINWLSFSDALWVQIAAVLSFLIPQRRYNQWISNKPYNRHFALQFWIKTSRLYIQSGVFYLFRPTYSGYVTMLCTMLQLTWLKSPVVNQAINFIKRADLQAGRLVLKEHESKKKIRCTVLVIYFKFYELEVKLPEHFAMIDFPHPPFYIRITVVNSTFVTCQMLIIIYMV